MHDFFTFVLQDALLPLSLTSHILDHTHDNKQAESTVTRGVLDTGLNLDKHLKPMDSFGMW